MISETQYSEMKGRMPEIKALFHTRHYRDCISLCQLLLRTSKDQIYPVHKAYLHFYIALSEDTLLREMNIHPCERFEALDMAENHYIAALSALSAPESRAPSRLESVREASSPTSTISEESSFRGMSRRPSDSISVKSFESIESVSTSATSIYSDNSQQYDEESTPKRSDLNRPQRPKVTFRDDASWMQQKVPKKRPAPIITGNTEAPKFGHQRKKSGHARQYFDHLASFTRMLQSHLAGIRELKDSTVLPPTRFEGFGTARSRASSSFSRPGSRDVRELMSNEQELRRVRLSRRSMTFRPRFDPTSVQELCTVALSEC